ncbi:MAG: hypothetical protein H6744_20615 [Deltaproteobacteria bacterium]|nr:hypothetical protein [Deltaproteobacteria bacterium]
MQRSVTTSMRLFLIWGALAMAPAPVRASPPPPSARPMLPPGLDHSLRALLGEGAWRTPLEAGYRFERLDVSESDARFHLVRPDGTAAGNLRLVEPGGAPTGALRSHSFAVLIEAPTSPDPVSARLLEAAADAVVRNDHGGFWHNLPPPAAPPVEPDVPPPRWPLLLAGLLALAGLAAVATRLPRLQIEPNIKVTHILPSAIQATIYLYWGLYWRPLTDHLPLIGIQLVGAYALDIAFSYLRERRWRASFGPVPIVLSTNLFIQFTWAHAAAHALPIAVAILSRHLFRRDGHPIFNPSALGIAVLGVINLLWPALGDPDIAIEFALAPSMTEVLLLLALVVQLRIPVVLVSLGVFVGLDLHNHFASFSTFTPSWPPVALVAMLLATDPATIPRTGAGRLCSGLVFGLGMGLVGHWLTVHGLNDFYGKVLPLPLVNLAAPWFDRVGRRLTSRLSLLHPRFNKAHIVLWLAVVSYGLYRDKRFGISEHDLYQDHVPCLVRPPAGQPLCPSNPLFCQPFRFDLELACWTHSTAPANASDEPR